MPNQLTTLRIVPNHLEMPEYIGHRASFHLNAGTCLTGRITDAVSMSAVGEPSIDPASWVINIRPDGSPDGTIHSIPYPSISWINWHL